MMDFTFFDAPLRVTRTHVSAPRKKLVCESFAILVS